MMGRKFLSSLTVHGTLHQSVLDQVKEMCQAHYMDINMCTCMFVQEEDCPIYAFLSWQGQAHRIPPAAHLGRTRHSQCFLVHPQPTASQVLLGNTKFTLFLCLDPGWGGATRIVEDYFISGSSMLMDMSLGELEPINSTSKAKSFIHTRMHTHTHTRSNHAHLVTSHC